MLAVRVDRLLVVSVPFAKVRLDWAMAPLAVPSDVKMRVRAGVATVVNPGPVGPVVPVDPVLPVGPVAPSAPIYPADPVSPVGPVMPVAPCAPSAPTYPGRPVGPVSPRPNGIADDQSFELPVFLMYKLPAPVSRKA